MHCQRGALLLHRFLETLQKHRLLASEARDAKNTRDQKGLSDKTQISIQNVSDLAQRISVDSNDLSQRSQHSTKMGDQLT